MVIHVLNICYVYFLVAIFKGPKPLRPLYTYIYIYIVYIYIYIYIFFFFGTTVFKLKGWNHSHPMSMYVL